MWKHFISFSLAPALFSFVKEAELLKILKFTLTLLNIFSSNHIVPFLSSFWLSPVILLSGYLSSWGTDCCSCLRLELQMFFQSDLADAKLFPQASPQPPRCICHHQLIPLISQSLTYEIKNLSYQPTFVPSSIFPNYSSKNYFSPDLKPNISSTSSCSLTEVLWHILPIPTQISSTLFVLWLFVS